jgi:glycerol-3-phosphate acyltransferase PlsY
VEAFNALLLAVAAFWLGACPFSVWVGQRFLGEDIRDYGDGNPGAANVLRAGGRKAFWLALILDVTKGVPFVFLAHAFWKFPEPVVMGVALSAILGHAFSPLLGFKGGKSLAVTFGVLLALPQHEILFAFMVFLLIGFLFMEGDAWTEMLGAVGSLAYLVIAKGSLWESLFMLCLLAILAVKHFNDLQTIPRSKVRILAWIQSIRR